MLRKSALIVAVAGGLMAGQSVSAAPFLDDF